MQVHGSPPSPGPRPPFLSPPPIQSHSQYQPASSVPGPSTYSGPTSGLTERREPESRPVSPGRVSRPRPPPVPGTHSMTLRPSTAPQRVPLPSPPASSLPNGPDPASDSLRAASPAVTRFLATAVTDPLFESTAASALVTELVDFAAACRLDYATCLVVESASLSVCPPSLGGECALDTYVLEDRQYEFECFAAAVPHLVSMLLAPEGDPDALDIPTPRSYAEAIEGPYSSQWQAAMDAEMASWKSTGTYVDEVPPPGAIIVNGMWIFRVKRPPGSLTSGVGLVLGGRARVVLTGHADASWVDDLAMQRSSQGYTFSLGSGSVSWRSTHFSSVLSSSCEAEIYAGAMAAQELRWLTYLLTDLGEAPRSPPVLYVDNKAMLALCQEHRLEHRTKHIALHYFLARELQQRGQLRLAYVASQANTADVFTKALQPCDHQPCFAFLDRSCDLLFSPTLPMGGSTVAEARGQQKASTRRSRRVTRVVEVVVVDGGSAEYASTLTTSFFECSDRDDSDEDDIKGRRGRSASRRPLRDERPRKEKQALKKMSSTKDVDSSSGKGRDDGEASYSMVGVVEPPVSLVPEASEDFKVVATAVQANPMVTVEGRCTVALQGEARKQILIPDVLYVPGMQANLLSASQLRESSLNLQGDGDEMQLVLIAGEILSRARFTGRILYTDLRPCSMRMASTKVVALWTIASATKSTPDRWYARLAHVGIDTIKSLAKHEFATGLDIKPSTGPGLPCVSCVGGKLARHTFSDKGSNAEEALAVVHINLCGPFRVAAKDGSLEQGWEVLDLTDNKVATSVKVIFYETLSLEVWKVNYVPASGWTEVHPPTDTSTATFPLLAEFDELVDEHIVEVLPSPLPLVPVAPPLITDLLVSTLDAEGSLEASLVAPANGIAGGRRASELVNVNVQSSMTGEQ
ncbi:unnamed protein product [Closterium sp. NIES-53]